MAEAVGFEPTRANMLTGFRDRPLSQFGTRLRFLTPYYITFDSESVVIMTRRADSLPTVFLPLPKPA